MNDYENLDNDDNNNDNDNNDDESSEFIYDFVNLDTLYLAFSIIRDK